MRGAESDTPLTDRVSEVGLQPVCPLHPQVTTQQQYKWQSCCVVVGKFTVVFSNSKGAAGKVPAEVSWSNFFPVRWPSMLQQLVLATCLMTATSVLAKVRRASASFATQ